VTPRHVWVTDVGRVRTHRLPGVAFDRRRGSGGWEYLVAYADGGGNIQTRSYVEWLPAGRVTPADETPPTGP
jgi:hypothetical protein